MLTLEELYKGCTKRPVVKATVPTDPWGMGMAARCVVVAYSVAAVAILLLPPIPRDADVINPHQQSTNETKQTNTTHKHTNQTNREKAFRVAVKPGWKAGTRVKYGASPTDGFPPVTFVVAVCACVSLLLFWGVVGRPRFIMSRLVTRRSPARIRGPLPDPHDSYTRPPNNNQL